MTDYIYIRECPICSNTESRLMGTRNDGVRVLQCTQCGMGYVERYPCNLGNYYDDLYYYQNTSDTIAAAQPSYGDYDSVASVSLGWGIFLTPYLQPSGDILDVGCANGYFLKSLDSTSYNKYGIEVNHNMVEQCEAAGITIIGTDICAQDLARQYPHKFDLITGFAVLEHIPNIVQALANIKAMLKPAGTFLFEVPVISEQYSNDIWFRTSLEHIYYPTVRSIEYLFQNIFGNRVIGQETYIKDYGCTYIGMSTQEEQAYQQLEQLFSRFFWPILESDSGTDIPEDVATFKFLYDIIYAADIERANMRIFTAISPQQLPQAHLVRLLSLWRRDIHDTAALKAATQWLEEQRRRWEVIAQEQGDLLHKDEHNWQTAVQQEQMVAQELRRWNQQLEQAKSWLEEQRATWQATAERLSSDLMQLQRSHDRLYKKLYLLRPLYHASARIRKFMLAKHSDKPK